MQLEDHFRQLMTGTVNLSAARLATLEERVDTIYDFLDADPVIGAMLTGKVPAGSWTHKAIINPPAGKEFDGDVMLVMERNDEWDSSPKTYIEKVYAALHGSSTYKGKAERHCRCVRVTYANNFHVDLVPFVERDGTDYIVDGDNDEWERTDPEAFTKWMRDKDDLAQKHLREVIRLLKFLRDHKSNFQGTKSVILTTLLGERVTNLAVLNDPACYSTLPKLRRF